MGIYADLGVVIITHVLETSEISARIFTYGTICAGVLKASGLDVFFFSSI